MSTVNMLAAWVLQIPVYPYLWLPHCCMMNLALRATLGHGPAARKFAKQHPLTCYIMAILYTFPGGLFSLVLLNQPLLTFLTWSNNLYSSTVIWYLMFFGPGDFLYRLLTTIPLLTLVFSMVQDWLRIGLVVSGVNTIMETHPQAFLYPVVFATMKSSGLMIVKYIEQIALHGLDRAPFVLPHHATKTMVVAACLLTGHQLGLVLPGLEQQELHVCLIILAVFLRLVTTLLYKNWDPYSSLESQACSLLYGRPEDETEKEDEETENKDKETENKEAKKDK